MRTLVLTMVFLLFAQFAEAHTVRSALVTIEELEPGRGHLLVRRTVADPELRVLLPHACTVSARTAHRSSVVQQTNFDRWSFSCSQPLEGGRMRVSGLGPIHGHAVVVVDLADGRRASRLLLPASPTFRIPTSTSASAVLYEYVRLGVEHIALGFDHLLLLLLLVLLLRRTSKVLLAEAAFTLSHTLTFALTSLGVVRVPLVWAEACIAVSLVLLAMQVAKNQPQEGNTAEAALVALIFGLVHGLGFAGGLGEMGLPESNILAAIAGFGLGVEIGQLAFIAMALVLASTLRRCVAGRRRLIAYGAGAISGYWMVARVLAF